MSEVTEGEELFAVLPVTTRNKKIVKVGEVMVKGKVENFSEGLKTFEIEVEEVLKWKGKDGKIVPYLRKGGENVTWSKDKNDLVFSKDEDRFSIFLNSFKKEILVRKNNLKRNL